MPITALIADDEPLARADIRMRLKNETDIEIVGEANDGPGVVTAIMTLRPDLVFLDVQMPGFDGMEVLRRVGSQHLPSIIFVTAYDKYAVRAFAINAIDYLLKPITSRRFQQAIERARFELKEEKALNRRQDKLMSLLHGGDEGSSPSANQPAERNPNIITRIAVKDHHRYVVLHTTDIDWIRSAANYVELHSKGRCLLLRGTLATVEERLDPSLFIRVHRTSIVNVERIREILPAEHGDSTIKLENGTCLRLSRKYRQRVFAYMYPGK